MRHKLLFLILAGLLSLTLAIPAQAATSTKPTIKILNATSTKASEAVKSLVKGVIARCPIIESKIQVKVTTFDNTKIKHLTVYNNLKNRLTKIADRLTARGVDLTALKSDLAVLDTKIAKFNADYADYIAKLKSSQDYVCGKSEGQFKTQLKDTKTALQQVHKDAADIRAYYVSTIRIEIMKLRDSIKASATSTPETSSSTKATSTPERKKVKPIVPALPKVD